MARRLITTNITASAKMPITKVTLDHVQEAYNEQFRAVCRSIGTDDAGGTPGQAAYDILYGLQATIVGSTFSCNRGAVYSGGEIYLVPAASFTIASGQVPIMVRVETYDAGDPIQFSDGNPYNIHAIRVYNVVSGTFSTPNYAGEFSTFTNKNLPIEVRSGAGITNGSHITGGIAYAKKDKLGLVVMHGFVQMNNSFSASSPNNVVCTLPATHRPVQDTTFIGSIVNGTTFRSITLRIDDATGNIACIADPSSQIGNNAVIHLDNIVFYTI
jgi:hypothetical protein